LPSLGLGGHIVARTANLGRSSALELVCILRQGPSTPSIAPAIEDLGQYAKGLGKVRLLLADLEQHLLGSLQVPLREQSSTELDFLDIIGLRCDQR
jgi:hypothetical protein